MNEWYEARKFLPQIVCEVELSDGEFTKARYVIGNWETLEGEVIYPVKFRWPNLTIERPLYSVATRS